MTGAPRSGTTWLARELADRPRTAMPGREPMNPKAGQLALGGTLDGWAQLDQLTDGQRRFLRRCFRGFEARAYSKYGVRRPLAPLPWVSIVVKDPFALLSVPAVVHATNSVPVVIYRHPGAVLASYRRVGWLADTDEMRRLQGREPLVSPLDEVTAMGEFWTFLHRRVLEWVPMLAGAVVVSHAELVGGGARAVELVARAAGLPPRRSSHGVTGSSAKPSARQAREPRVPRLHDFDRRPEEVADGWRGRLHHEEIEAVEDLASTTWDELESHRLRVL